MLPISDEDMRFDGDISIHGHFRCLKCHKIYDLRLHERDLATIVDIPTQFTVKNAAIILTGFCNDCH